MTAVPYDPASDPGDFWLVTAAGELDIATLPRLETDLAGAFSTSFPSPPLLVVDLRAVTFIDCSTVRVLLRADTAASAREGWLGLVCPPVPIGRLLRRVGLDRVLPQHGSVDEAVIAYRRSSGKQALGPRMAYERNTPTAT